MYISDQTSGDKDSTKEVALFCRPVPQRKPPQTAVHGTTWRSAEKTSLVKVTPKKENAI